MLKFRPAGALLAAAGMAAVMSAGAPGASAKIELNLVYPFPDFLIYTKQCKQLAADITKAAGGKLAINVPAVQLDQDVPAAARRPQGPGRSGLHALRLLRPGGAGERGGVDSRLKPGGRARQWRPRHAGRPPAKIFGVKNLRLDLIGRPLPHLHGEGAEVQRQGMLDLAGVKLRDNPIYGAFFRAMNATTHPLPATQVYSALEKGVVNAAAWATIGMKGLKWDKFLRHAVEPEFYHTDIGWFINLKKWNSLDAGLRKLVQDMVIANELAARKVLLEESKKERATLAKEGMTFHTVPAAAVYSKLAIDSAYDRMVDRLKKAKRPTGHVAKLRELWQQQ